MRSIIAALLLVGKMNNLYRIDKMSHNDVREAADLLGISTACMLWAIDILRERLVPVERCEHGKVDPHEHYPAQGSVDRWGEVFFCDGAGLEGDTE